MPPDIAVGGHVQKRTVPTLKLHIPCAKYSLLVSLSPLHWCLLLFYLSSLPSSIAFLFWCLLCYGAFLSSDASLYIPSPLMPPSPLLWCLPPITSGASLPSLSFSYQRSSVPLTFFFKCSVIFCNSGTYSMASG